MKQVCILTGRLTKESELKNIRELTILNNTIAIDRPYKKDAQITADFFDITVFGKTAENMNKFTGKGSLVQLNGTFQNQKYETKEGQKRQSTKFIVSDVLFLDKKSATTKDEYPKFDASKISKEDFKHVDDEDIPF